MNENHHMVVKGLSQFYNLSKMRQKQAANCGLPAMATLCVLVHLGLTNYIKSKNSLRSASYVYGTMLHAIGNIKISYMIQQLFGGGGRFILMATEYQYDKP